MNTPVSTTIEEQIAGARARAITQRAEAAADAEAQRQVEAEQAMDELQRDLAVLVVYVPQWAHEYFELRTSPPDEWSTTVRRRLNLPGCSPIALYYDRAGVSYCEALEPTGIIYSGTWRVKFNGQRAFTFEEAVDLAADWGESWHEMATEAARRNEQDLRPAPHAPEPDDVDLAGKLLKAYADGQLISARTEYDSNDDGNVLNGALLYAIATQLRRIANALEADCV